MIAEIQPAACRCLERDKNWAGHFFGALACTAPVAVSGMHVEVAAIPPGSAFDRRIGKPIQACSFSAEIDVCFHQRYALRANVAYAQQQFPAPRDNCTRQIGGCGILGTESERVLVASTPSTETLRIGNAEIQCGAFILSTVRETNLSSCNLGA